MIDFTLHPPDHYNSKAVLNAVDALSRKIHRSTRVQVIWRGKSFWTWGGMTVVDRKALGDVLKEWEAYQKPRIRPGGPLNGMEQ